MRQTLIISLFASKMEIKDEADGLEKWIGGDLERAAAGLRAMMHSSSERNER